MKQRRLNVILPEALTSGVRRTARTIGVTQSHLVERALRDYLSRKPLPLHPLPASAEALSDEQRQVIALREQIVRQWDAQRRKADQEGRSRDEATKAFLTRLRLYQGLRLSKGTLYIWYRRLTRGGPLALIDRRSLRYDQTAFNPPSNRTRQYDAVRQDGDEVGARNRQNGR